MKVIHSFIIDGDNIHVYRSSWTSELFLATRKISMEPLRAYYLEET